MQTQEAITGKETSTVEFIHHIYLAEINTESSIFIYYGWTVPDYNSTEPHCDWHFPRPLQGKN